MESFAGRGLTRVVVDAIAGRITGGQLPAGSTLNLTALCAEFDVSLTVVREALRVLKAKGMIDARPKRGTFVRPQASWNQLDPDVLTWQFTAEPDTALLDDLSEIRAILEPAAARLAAVRRTDEDLASLGGALDAMRAAGRDVEAHVAADLAFHRALLLAGNNRFMRSLEVVIEAGLRVRNQLVHQRRATHDALVPLHEAVFEAVRDRAATAAERAMLDLLERAAQDAREVALEGPSDKPLSPVAAERHAAPADT